MKQKKVQERYDLTADIYDKRYKDIQFEKFSLLLSDLSFKGRILDHGCGTGLLSEFLHTKLFGVDLSFEMLKKAKERGELVVQGDLEHLPFKDNSFNNVLSFTALQNVSHPEQALDELKRITKEKLVLTYLDKFDFSKQIEKRFDTQVEQGSTGPQRTRKSSFRVQEIRQAGEDIGFVLSA